MKIITERDPADRPGDEIVSSILTTEESKIERGTHDIDTYMDDRLIYKGLVLSTTFMQPGTTSRVINRGQERKGLNTGFSCSISLSGGINIRSQVTVETIK